VNSVCAPGLSIIFSWKKCVYLFTRIGPRLRFFYTDGAGVVLGVVHGYDAFIFSNLYISKI